MVITAKQKEQINMSVRFLIAALGGGLMITFANFTMLVGLSDAWMFLVMMILIGMLVGMYSTEIQYGIIAGMFSILLGFLIFYGVIVIPVVVFATWELYDILLLFGVFVIVRVVMLQLVGIMLGAVLGRLIGPAWYEPTVPKHKLRIGINGEIEGPDAEEQKLGSH